MIRIMRLFMLGSLAFATPALTQAHEHWIDVDDFCPAANTPVNVNICSGHYFPKSSFALKENVLNSVELINSGGEITSIETTAKENNSTGTFALKSEGTAILHFTLKRKQAKDPSYEAKAILISKNGEDKPASYATGSGLELAPSQALTGLKKGDELPLFLLLDGKRVSGSIEIVPEGGKTSFLKTETDKAAMLRLSESGRYLATTSIKGRGCSLVFCIPESLEKSE